MSWASEWERCPKRHGQAQHLLDCDPIEPEDVTMAEVLVQHQRQNASSCLCGWSELGRSHPEHQAAALSAAGFGRRPEQEVVEVTVPRNQWIMLHVHGPEEHARSYNEGYEAAVSQGLADDPTLADEWLQAKLQEARVEALEGAAVELERRVTEAVAEWRRSI